MNEGHPEAKAGWTGPDVVPISLPRRSEGHQIRSGSRAGSGGCLLHGSSPAPIQVQASRLRCAITGSRFRAASLAIEPDSEAMKMEPSESGLTLRRGKRVIGSIEDWFEAAPPKGRARHGRRGAARWSWQRRGAEGTGGPRFPPNLPPRCRTWSMERVPFWRIPNTRSASMGTPASPQTWTWRSLARTAGGIRRRHRGEGRRVVRQPGRRRAACGRTADIVG